MAIFYLLYAALVAFLVVKAAREVFGEELNITDFQGGQ